MRRRCLASPTEAAEYEYTDEEWDQWYRDQVKVEVMAEVKAEVAAEVKAEVAAELRTRKHDKSWDSYGKSWGYKGWNNQQTGGWSKWKQQQWDDKRGWFLDDNIVRFIVSKMDAVSCTTFTSNLHACSEWWVHCKHAAPAHARSASTSSTRATSSHVPSSASSGSRPTPPWRSVQSHFPWSDIAHTSPDPEDDRVVFPDPDLGCFFLCGLFAFRMWHVFVSGVNDVMISSMSPLPFRLFKGHRFYRDTGKRVRDDANRRRAGQKY